jgi:hypothetical protein
MSVSGFNNNLSMASLLAGNRLTATQGAPAALAQQASNNNAGTQAGASLAGGQNIAQLLTL